jgi:hypothetical protein
MSSAVPHFREVAPKYMAMFLADFPRLNKLDAAAVFGNFGHESKGLTDDQEDAPTVKGSRGGRNWAQWTGPRRRALESYCKRNGLDPDSDIAAYKFLWVELHGDEKKAIDALRAAVTLEQKVVAFEKAYLRAGIKHYPERQRWARIALEAYEAADWKAIEAEPVPEVPVAPQIVPDNWLGALIEIIKALFEWIKGLRK